MPAHVPALHGEPALLAAYINQQLGGLRCAAYGLTADQARDTPTASSLSIEGLLSHAMVATHAWLDRVEAAPEHPQSRHASAEDAAAAHRAEWQPTKGLDSLVTELEQLQERVTAVTLAADLDAAVPVPSDAPWWPQDVASWQVRWALLHLVEEVARHAGHADIIRESIDGATMYELRAAVEGWPATDWLQPWSPATIKEEPK